MARIGYVARGLVHIGIGYIALRASLGVGSPQGTAGTLRELMRGGGRWLMLALAVGLLAHAVWRAVQAFTDPECPHGERRRLLRALYLLSALINGSLALTALGLFRGARTSNEDGEERTALLLFEQPAGRWLVALVGLAVIGYAIQQVVVAVRARFARLIDAPDGRVRRAVIATGRVGIAARAVVLAILGGFFLDAARRYDPRAAGGLDEALRWLGQGWLLAAIAAGLIAFGVLQFAYARYRRLRAG